MSTGETEREQSPQKVSSTFLLKLAPSCVCNSIFNPAACQSHCAELPAHASGFGAQCPGRGAAAAWGTGKVPPRPLCRVARGCMSVQPVRVAPRQRVRPSASCASLRGQNPSRTDRHKHHHRCRQMGADRGKEQSERKEEGERGQWARDRDGGRMNEHLQRGREGGRQSAEQPDMGPALHPVPCRPPGPRACGKSQWARPLLTTKPPFSPGRAGEP